MLGSAENISGIMEFGLQETTKTMLANKDNSSSSLYVQLTVCIHLTIYSSLIRSILSPWVKLKWGKMGQRQNGEGPFASLGAANCTAGNR